MDSCIFCKIVRGEIPSWTVYEDDLVKAFFDVNPASEGHTLIIPKKHYQDINDIPEETIKHLSATLKKLAKQYGEKAGFKEFNIMHASGKNAQQTVFHFHMHLVPRHKDDGLDLLYKTNEVVKKNFDRILGKLKD